MGGPGSGPPLKPKRRGRNVIEGPEPLVGKQGKGMYGKRLVWQRPRGPWIDWEMVLEWYSNLENSGQAEFYEQSDADYAYIAAEVLYRALVKNSPPLFSQFNEMCSRLLITIKDRRVARLELQKENPPEAPSVAAVARYKVIAGQSE